MKYKIFPLIFLFSIPAICEEAGPSGCSEMEVWDYGSAMCMPLPMKDMPMQMLMVHGNAFLVGISQTGARGRDRLAAPNMLMADLGTSVGDNHYLNLEVMGTFEKWTFPKEGYPELLQIGEENEDHIAYVDAQHPHSSPIMGLTFSDTISLGRGKDHLKIFLAPRGAATDGPIAFMHRPTGMVNPDAPLGHHIGQDVGHITSTVVGTSLRLGDSNFEISNFNGREPLPTNVDLPLGNLNSYATRFTQSFSGHLYAMISAAYIKQPEPHDPTLDHVWRYSSSVYHDAILESGWTLQDTWIYGLINSYDNASALSSFGQELLFHKDARKLFTRLEILQRTPAELRAFKASDPDEGRWVAALTFGSTHQVKAFENSQWAIGASATVDFLPPAYQEYYGPLPLTGKIFLNWGGMKMSEL